ncbi:aminotransferase-like domain-containing protein [Leucobacter sp. USHLN153]|uniref:aminotransferase-like domain-containing protein n=1 Tax=Leucobacter sp. USHLN153 TaxID=3081268 RepID=UPI003019B23E
MSGSEGVAAAGAAGGRHIDDFPVHLDRDSDAPLPSQLAAALREAIDADLMRPGEMVPATRELARRLGVARGVVVTAYEQLAAEGYLEASQGRRTRVHPALARAAESVHAGARGDGAVRGHSADGEDRPHVGRPNAEVSAQAPAGSGGASEVSAPDGTSGAGSPGASARRPIPASAASLLEGSAAGAEPGSGALVAGSDGELENTGAPSPLAPGVAITEGVVGPSWRAAWRAAASDATAAPALGDPELRREISEHLRRTRGTPRAAHDVLVTAGTRDGLWLLLTALGVTRGRELVVGVEDPGLPSLRGVALRAGARIVALPTDQDGLDTARLPDGVLDLVIVTPSHQYPLGGSLPLVRRRELLAWARRNGVVVVEDDFDSELRYTGSPLPTLAALDDPAHGVVVLLGTFSRTLTPALGAGYLLAPAGLRSRIEPLRRDLGGPVSSVVQAALARYLASGELRRHTTRMLRRYAARRDLVSDRLAGANDVRVRPMDGGLHAVLQFVGEATAARRREARAFAASERDGLGAQALGRYWQRQTTDGMSGLVIGLGGTDDVVFDAALGRLRGILDAH